ncbi:MAG: methyltransferase domain-containing protein [Gemmatimonadaceae bacterium]|nr:methyltransferase domain-containing protein [Gemmatimonadaceae bacterium]
MGLLVPARRRGTEYLDAPHLLPGDQAVRELADVTRTNALFGGTAAVLAEVRACLAQLPTRSTLLDVGTGLGDIPARAAAMARRAGRTLVTLGLERAEAVARAARGAVDGALVADAFRLPFADRSVDVVTCSQVLHHFDERDAVALLAECDRVARRRVIVADIRRSWWAAAGVWSASWPLGFSAWARHDGVLSVLRGFTAPELAALARRVTSATVLARPRPGFRVTCAWTPLGHAA